MQIFFGATGADENSRPFHYFLRKSLQDSAVLIYNGHSGLGGHLDLTEIVRLRGFKKMELNPEAYQIFFFNSCTSYTYYNSRFFQKKRKPNQSVDPKGTKNLDILANGLSTSFDSDINTDMALVNAIHVWVKQGQRTSYKTMARRIDTDNLFTVNGDEDNPTSPRR